MDIPFLDSWRRRRTGGRSTVLASAFERDPQGVAGLLSECALLRSRAEGAGVPLDDTPRSLEALDQLPPRWREDPEELPWLGNDAGLYLGTVIVRTVPGAVWDVLPGGRVVVRLASGREVDVVGAGLDWAISGSPQLSQTYGEAAEGR
ncbi:DUF6278 family protein [Streptomyces somaliensis]|uniref:Uncharacterized protein n=1 Tax=Streptomyces somaliensis (strain ATCC 33201 / DSM 40738 / JCM 12659 / KCTC 9044 / NCTC 11332 / NRRL B-12077 / IP 733) TaxID=1134445 RepID=A0AA44ID08_STRE0|nr:DUF6278 family protein [Streptomyces somaliensis]MCP9943683.1 DUF6278 family protein [Streptomyces somaliensis]MCP9975922.1 DUF6278 family protein [Streptomyces somaliensis]MCQ0025265.1 DUF6278 family protein [Streptomyces somaliensis DSM 40738]NKY13763.1 hypothetical protein [Streptomyces somaliensis DSM 40738]